MIALVSFVDSNLMFLNVKRGQYLQPVTRAKKYKASSLKVNVCVYN